MLRSFRGKHPRVHPTAFVSEAAYVVGDVEIGEGSSVWPGTVIRADVAPIRIGRFTNIQDNSVVHSDHGAVIGDYVTLGHGVVCHAARVGDYTLIGNNATVNDPAEVGDHCIIAANAVVLEGVKVPPYSLVAGAPGEVKRRVSERHLEMLERIPRHYAEKARLFKEAGLGDPIPEDDDPNSEL